MIRFLNRQWLIVGDQINSSNSNDRKLKINKLIKKLLKYYINKYIYNNNKTCRIINNKRNIDI